MPPLESKPTLTSRFVAFLSDRLVYRVLAVAFVLGYALQAITLLKQPTAPYDFKIYYLAALAMARGYGPYVAILNPPLIESLAREVNLVRFIGGYFYPPLTVQIILPFTWLPLPVAAYLWLLILIVAALASARFLGQTFARPYAPTLALFIVMLFSPLYWTLVAGQINGLMLAALCWAFYRGSRHDEAGLGVGVAVGAMLKTVPLAHLAYLGWQRRWKAFAVGVAACGLLLLSAVPFIGWQGLADAARAVVTSGTPGDRPIGDLGSVSLGGLIGYLAAAGGQSRAIWLLAVISVLGVTAAACWPTAWRRDRFEMEFALVTLAANLVTPFAYYHQFVLMVIPFFVLTKHLLTATSRRWPRRWPLGLLLLAYGLVNLAVFPALIGRSPASTGIWVVAFAPTYISLALWGCIAVWLIRQKIPLWRQTAKRLNSPSS